LRATDLSLSRNDTYQSAFKRIYNDELHDTKVGSPHFVGSIFHASKRGTEQAQLYWVEVLEQPLAGTFYDVSQLPDMLIESQRKFIYEAANHFTNSSA
jgi:hypothetical protein